MQDPERRHLADDWLALLNPPLAAAGAAGCLAGALVGGSGASDPGLYALPTASTLLFAAGSLFSHHFDRDADAGPRPDRPLPSGRIGQQSAWRTGFAMLAAGIL